MFQSFFRAQAATQIKDDQWRANLRARTAERSNKLDALPSHAVRIRNYAANHSRRCQEKRKAEQVSCAARTRQITAGCRKNKNQFPTRPGALRCRMCDGNVRKALLETVQLELSSAKLKKSPVQSNSLGPSFSAQQGVCTLSQYLGHTDSLTGSPWYHFGLNFSSVFKLKKALWVTSYILLSTIP